MPIRRTWRKGDWLVLDDESGAVHYASQMRRIWNGTLRHHSMYETRQPQEFIKARNDPAPLSDIRPETPTSAAVNTAGVFIGNTTVPVPKGPAYHLFDPGIGEMSVGPNGSFVVR